MRTQSGHNKLWTNLGSRRAYRGSRCKITRIGRGMTSCCTGSQIYEKIAEHPQPTEAVHLQKREINRYQVVWSGKTARACDTSTMMCIEEDHWDNFHFMALHILDRISLRIVHTIDVSIDKAEGWAPDAAAEKIKIMRGDLEELLRAYSYEFERGIVRWDDIQA